MSFYDIKCQGFVSICFSNALVYQGNNEEPEQNKINEQNQIWDVKKTKK